MSTDKDNPLNDVHCKCLDAVLESSARLAEKIAKCKACGLDMEDAERANMAHREFATKAKQQFFPDRV